MKHKKDPLQEQIDRSQLNILREMERQGREKYRAAVVGVATYMSAGGVIVAIALVFFLPWYFYVFAAVLLFAAVRSWLNMRDMERFIETVHADMLEIQK